MGELPRKIRALGCDVDVLTMSEVLNLVVGWLSEIAKIRESSSADLPPGRFVVTPNLDHAVLLREHPALQAAYDDAALVLADGMPLVWASRIFGRPLPERVTGSDLTPGLLQAADKGTKAFFLGATEESSLAAVENVKEKYPNIELVGRLSPPLGFEKSADWSDRIVNEIVSSEASLVLVGFGAPKQEVWVHQHYERLPGTVILCAGATIDFLAGSVNRAPLWAQKWGVEWVHRLLSDPKRLARRYGKDALYLPGLMLRDARYRGEPQDKSSE